MPSVSIESTNLRQSGPLLDVLIGPSMPIVEALKKSKEEIPKLKQCVALIDTGASVTVVKDSVTSSLNLNPRGVTTVSTPSCANHRCNTFDISLYLPEQRIQIPILTIIESSLGRRGIGCLIGRDLLSESIFIYEGCSNRFVLSI